MLSKRKNMLHRKYRIFYFLIVTALVLACAPTLVPASVPAPTFDPNSINTAIGLTAEAAATQTALMKPPTLTPTVTMLPSNTPPPTESPTPTFIFILSTPTVPSSTPTLDPDGSKFACRVDSKTPPDNTAFTQGANFDARWLVTNIGTVAWDAGSTDYRFNNGDKFHKAAVYDFNSSVSPGQQTEIVVDMKAPDSGGTYTTTWKINVGKNKFCSMSLTIIVN